MHRLRPQPDKRLAFLQGFLRYPHLVASVIPSSRFLERRLIEFSALSEARLVVELGPGTGGTTRAIMRTLPEDSRLLAIEINPKFTSLLESESESDPRLIVYRGSAEHIGHALVSHGLTEPDVVVSGIPFSTMPLHLGRRIVGSLWDSLAPGGRFVAYQFRDRIASLGREILGDPQVDVELFNVPPMRFYRWDKPAKPLRHGIKGEKHNGKDVNIAPNI